jgi:lipoprotein-releasing system permease protein
MSIEFKISNQYLRSNRKKGFVSFISGVMPIKMLDLPNSASGIRLKVDDLFNAKKITNEVINSLNSSRVKLLYCQPSPLILLPNLCQLRC